MSLEQWFKRRASNVVPRELGTANGHAVARLIDDTLIALCIAAAGTVKSYNYKPAGVSCSSCLAALNYYRPRRVILR